MVRCGLDGETSQGYLLHEDAVQVEEPVGLVLFKSAVKVETLYGGMTRPQPAEAGLSWEWEGGGKVAEVGQQALNYNRKMNNCLMNTEVRLELSQTPLRGCSDSEAPKAPKTVTNARHFASSQKLCDSLRIGHLQTLGYIEEVFMNLTGPLRSKNIRVRNYAQNG